ncbi:hypothetical protein Tco_0675973, partial [Tanacetum coccineum]
FVAVNGSDGTKRGYQGRCLGEAVRAGATPSLRFLFPAPLPRYAGNPNNNNGWLEVDDNLLGELKAMVDKQMVVPAIEEVAEPVAESEEE